MAGGLRSLSDTTPPPQYGICQNHAPAEQEKAAFNAGIGLIGLIGALEGTSMETARQIVETNTIGTLAVTQGVSPQFGVATEASS